MPTYNLKIGDSSFKVELDKKEKVIEAKIDGDSFRIMLEEVDPDRNLPKSLRIGDKKHKVELDKIRKHTPFKLKIDGVIFTAQILEPTRRKLTHQYAEPTLARPERTRVQTGKQGAIVAPMAGKIVSIKVKKGDSVEAGDTVCILEAMKMENGITTTSAGIVQEITVEEGASVNKGDILVLVK